MRWASSQWCCSQTDMSGAKLNSIMHHVPLFHLLSDSTNPCHESIIPGPQPPT